jgi:hypothetical protein
MSDQAATIAGDVRRGASTEHGHPRRVIVDNFTFDMCMSESKPDVMFGVAVFERRRRRAARPIP